MSDGKLLQGQQYDAENDLVIRYTQQMREISSAASLLGNSLTEIIPTDGAASIVREYQVPANLADYYFASPTTINLQLPDVLEDVLITWSSRKEDGEKVNNPGTFLFTGSGSDSLSSSATASAGGSITPDAQPIIRQTWAQNIPSMRYSFYIEGNVSTQDVLDRLGTITGQTVLAFPVFKPKAITITLTGQSTSLQSSAEIRASIHVSDNGNGGSTNDGTGVSRDTSISIKTIRIPPTLHDTITFSANEYHQEETFQALATAKMPRIVGTGVDIPANIKGVPQYATIKGDVMPHSITATTPTNIPTSGLYAVQIECRLWKYNWTSIQATVVDFEQLV